MVNNIRTFEIGVGECSRFERNGGRVMHRHVRVYDASLTEVILLTHCRPMASTCFCGYLVERSAWASIRVRIGRGS